MASNSNFEPKSIPLSKVFCDSDSFYQIPDYQRPYSWDEEQIGQLWLDIKEAFEGKSLNEEEEDGYFLGSLILIKRDGEYEVVDGQQRLTTLTILFCVIRDYFPEIKNNYVPDAVINNMEQKKRLRFKTNFGKQNNFENEIQKRLDLPEKMSKKEGKENPYKNAAFLIRKLAGEEKPEILQGMIDYLFKQTNFITITCYSPHFAIKLFQVLNARGLDLSPADLIKSQLMLDLDVNEHPQFIASWRKIEQKCENLEKEIVDMLTYYLYYLKADNPKKNLFDELRVEFSGKNPNQVIDDFEKFVDAYDEICDMTDKYTYALWYLNHDVYWSSILTGAKFENYNSFEELKNVLAKMYFKYWISGISIAKIKTLSYDLIKAVKSNDSIDTIKEAIDSKMKDDKVVQRIKENLLDDVYGKKWLKPLLYLVEYNQTDDTSQFFELITAIQVEHVLPQAWDKENYWVERFSKEEAEGYVDSIGNVTLLSGRKNVKARNYGFDKKKEIYDKSGLDEKATRFRISQWVFDNGNEWVRTDIEKRFNWIISEIGEVLDVDLSDVTFDKFNIEWEINEAA